MNRRWLAKRSNPLGWTVVIAIIALWQLVVETHLITFNYFPPPSAVAVALFGLIASGALFASVGYTLLVALASSVIAIVAGVLLGLFLGVVRPAGAFSSGSVDFLRSIPAVALMPVALLLLGPAPGTEVLVATFAALWPVLINTMGGIRATDSRLGEVALTLQLTKRETLRKIVVPSAIPSILVGARLSVITALVVAIIAEMMINPQGIGWALVSAQQSLRPDILFAYAVVAGAVGLLLNFALVQGTRWAMPGSQSLRSEG